MRISTLTALGILVIGAGGCTPPQPPAPAASVPTEATNAISEIPAITTPANATVPMAEPANAVAAPATTNEVSGSTDDPRSIPDRREK